MKKIICLLCLIATFACNNYKENIAKNGKRVINEKVLPFTATIFDSDYSRGGSNQYTITENDLTIIHHSGFVGVKDTIIYFKVLSPTENLKRISETNLDTLKEEYINYSVKDGIQILVEFKKHKQEKSVSIGNYYHPNIGQLIELVNTQVPKKFRISYRKEFLEHPNLR